MGSGEPRAGRLRGGPRDFPGACSCFQAEPTLEGKITFIYSPKRRFPERLCTSEGGVLGNGGSRGGRCIMAKGRKVQNAAATRGPSRKHPWERRLGWV